jgi:signal recognition particle subunit SRP54
MFDNLSKGLNAIFSKIKGKAVISEGDLESALREIRIALLEADVALPVIKQFINEIKDKALGAEVVKSIKPGQMIVKIIHDEMIKILGGVDEKPKLELKGEMPVIMMVGLQGSGKTTSAAKLALFLRKRYGRKPFLMSTDIYRPAAQLQLVSLAKQIDVPHLDIVSDEKPLAITRRGLDKAIEQGSDVIIIDTAGRLQTDDELMKELEEIKKLSNPTEVILVSDAMLGQEAVNVAQSFSDKIGITGIILTRIDGDSRGGAALSMKYVTNQPIKFVGVGEKVNEFEEFHAERAASRILGMGDIVSLVERASDVIEMEEVESMKKKMETGKIDMNDILKQLQNIKKIGSVSSIIGMIPGLGKIKDKLGDAMNDKVLKKQEAIIQSMTNKERTNPIIINASRKKRIAKGSGTAVSDVNVLLKKFFDMQMMFKKMGKMDPKKIQNMFSMLK